MSLSLSHISAVAHTDKFFVIFGPAVANEVSDPI